MVLIKKEPGIFWTTLVPGDVYGEHEIDGEEAAKMEEVHQSLAHLTSSNDNDMEVGPWYLCFLSPCAKAIQLYTILNQQ